MSVNKVVHCHICPLKELCSCSQKDASWRWQRYVQQTGDVPVPGSLYSLCEATDFEKVRNATGLCELRNKIQKKIQELKELDEALWAEGGIDALG